METLGMLLSLPWGLVAYVLITTFIFMVISEIWWKAMKHYPEDEQNWSDENRYVFKEDD
jgi:hypothetical protein